MRFASLIVAGLVTVGCAASPGEEVDGEHDDVLIDDGKGDTGGIREGSPQAKLILIYANRLSVAEMVEFGIAPITAKSIDAYRLQGLGPDDDEYFETLAELDNVLFVGPIAFDRFLESGGDLVGPDPGEAWRPDEPYEWNGCPDLGDRELSQILPTNGTSVVRPYSWQLVSRHRTCTSVSECTTWTDAPLSLKSKTTPAIYQVPTHGTVELERTAWGEFRVHLDSPTSPIGFTCVRELSRIKPSTKCTPYVNRDSTAPLLPPGPSLYFDDTARGYFCFDGRFQVTSHNYEHDYAIWGWL